MVGRPGTIFKNTDMLKKILIAGAIVGGVGVSCFAFAQSTGQAGTPSPAPTAPQRTTAVTVPPGTPGPVLYPMPMRRDSGGSGGDVFSSSPDLLWWLIGIALIFAIFHWME